MANKILSVFIDESGDFGKYDPKSPYYYVSMVLHDQSVDISSEIDSLEQREIVNCCGLKFESA